MNPQKKSPLFLSYLRQPENILSRKEVFDSKRHRAPMFLFPKGYDTTIRTEVICLSFPVYRPHIKSPLRTLHIRLFPMFQIRQAVLVPPENPGYFLCFAPISEPFSLPFSKITVHIKTASRKIKSCKQETFSKKSFASSNASHFSISKMYALLTNKIQYLPPLYFPPDMAEWNWQKNGTGPHHH